jgi:hypothetical protein
MRARDRWSVRGLWRLALAAALAGPVATGARRRWPTRATTRRPRDRAMTRRSAPPSARSAIAEQIAARRSIDAEMAAARAEWAAEHASEDAQREAERVQAQAERAAARAQENAERLARAAERAAERAAMGAPGVGGDGRCHPLRGRARGAS